MTTLTIQYKPELNKALIEIDLNRWEKLADAFGFCRPEFLKTIRRSLNDSKHGRVKKIESLQELD